MSVSMTQRGQGSACLLQVTPDDLAGDFVVLVFADPAEDKKAMENVRRLQDVTELSGGNISSSAETHTRWHISSVHGL